MSTSLRLTPAIQVSFAYLARTGSQAVTVEVFVYVPSRGDKLVQHGDGSVTIETQPEVDKAPVKVSVPTGWIWREQRDVTVRDQTRVGAPTGGTSALTPRS